MVTQKDLQDVVKALNEVLLHIDQRITKLEELAAKPASPRTAKKVTEKA